MGKAYWDEMDPYVGLTNGEKWRVEYSSEYLDFLNSDQWRRMSLRRRLIDNARCCMCGRPLEAGAVLESHHLTYQASYRGGFGTEDIWRDLVTLCRPCHIRVHNMMNRTTGPNGERGWRSEPGVPLCNSINQDSGRWDF